MSEVRETVREVCAEMLNRIVTDEGDYLNVGGDCAKDFHDRILSAYEREMAEKDAEIERLKEERNHARLDAQRKFSETLAAKDAEIARLKAAMKPVMECAVCKTDGTVVADGEICTSSDYGVCDYEGNELDWHDVAECLDAVRESQRIMKEGGER